jgi:hypothetical protein
LTSISTSSSPSLAQSLKGAKRQEPTLAEFEAVAPPETKDGLPDERELVSSAPNVTHPPTASTGNKQLFSRASQLIRDSLGLDGVMFVDASFRDIAIDPAHPVLLSPSPASSGYRGTPETPVDDRSDWLTSVECSTNVLGDSAIASHVPTGNSLNHNKHLASDILGYSTRSPSDIGELLSSATQAPLPQSTLRGLLQKYRHSHTFVFNDDGSVVQTGDKLFQRPTEEPVNDTTMHLNGFHGLEETWMRQLLNLCPGAKSIIFFPLWDPLRKQWFAGSLAWTRDPTRIIEQADITYLAAFGSCIMSEKSRLDTITADRAKSDFISSVSHELRSPLHGILASAEALQEVASSSTQEDMIQTIVGCGEALLDTVDQM